MLEVVSLEVAQKTVLEKFRTTSPSSHPVALEEALGKHIACDVVSHEGVPAFDRTTVDGFAVVASDTFGCSESLPALLELSGEVHMGEAVDCTCLAGHCVRIPTGGRLPNGADAVVMLEYCEDFGDGSIGVLRPVAPAENIVFKHDDVAPGQVLIKKGTALRAHHIGTLASLGYTTCEVEKPLRVGVISTGDEIVGVDATPVASQMRDVNTPMLCASVRACGSDARAYQIVADRFDELRSVVNDAVDTCDVVLISGGSSAGDRDNTARVLDSLGDVLFHGIAVKPGKPTLCACVREKPVFGLPGHPVAAYLMFMELVRPLIAGAGCWGLPRVSARLSEGVPSNNGRTELVAVRLTEGRDGLMAVPVRGKSGLISQLSDANGYFEIPRNKEGLAADAFVDVRLFE